MEVKEQSDMSVCPFCGSYDILACFTEGKKNEKNFFPSGCCACGACGPEAESVEEAAKSWNNWCGFHTANEKEFPPFAGSSPPVRPLTWSYELVTVGNDTTNAVKIYFPVNKGNYEVPGYHGEMLSSVSLTRAEIKEILLVLEDDIAKMRKHCPDSEFV